MAEPLLSNGIDVDAALENIGGNQAFYKRMMGKFIREYSDGAQRIRTISIPPTTKTHTSSLTR
jgi:hypothetical protein